MLLGEDGGVQGTFQGGLTLAAMARASCGVFPLPSIHLCINPPDETGLATFPSPRPQLYGSAKISKEYVIGYGFCGAQGELPALPPVAE